MSYIMFRQQCADCKAVWNAAFGIVGTTQIASPPKKCPKCGSEALTHFGDGWQMEDGSIFPAPLSTHKEG